MLQDLSPQILALWAVPRSTSTAFAKAISGGKGVRVLHEPFTDCYYFGPQRRSKRYGDSPIVAGYDAAAAQEFILSSAATSDRVFVKDLAFQAYHYLQDELLRKLTRTVLIRHPQRVMASLLRLTPDFTEEELGFQAIDALSQRITRLQGRPPAIIEGEQFRAHPRQTLLHFCTTNGLPFSEAMLRWGSGSLRPWLPHESESQQKWHATLEDSRTILPPSGSLPALELSGQHQAMLERALDIYDKLAPQALQHRLSRSMDRPSGTPFPPGPRTCTELSAVQHQGQAQEPRR